MRRAPCWVEGWVEGWVNGGNLGRCGDLLAAAVDGVRLAQPRRVRWRGTQSVTTDLFEAVRTRRSAGLLLDGSPSDDEVRDLVELAMTSPDHAGLRPWRLVLLRGTARNRLGRALAEAHGGDPDASGKAAAKPLRAPLLISIVFRPREHHKVPEWEQLAATIAVVTTLVLLLHGRGWGTMWRTGALLDSAPVRRALCLADDERLLGWLYVGEPDPNGGRSPRPQASVDPHVSVLTD